MVLGIASVISLVFGMWAFAASTRASEQKTLAEQSALEAKSQKTLAEQSAIEAQKNAYAATAQREIAEEQRKIAVEQSALAFKQGILLKKYAEEANKQKNMALLLKDSAEHKKEDFQKQLVKNALKNENFYFSNSLDQATKEAIIDSLFETPSFDTKQIQLAKYINLDLLKLINDAVRIKENVAEEPAINLVLAQEIWKANQHPVLKNILLSIVNDHIFSKGAIEVTGNVNLDSADLTVSNNNNFFALKNGQQVVTGKNENGRLVINENSFDVSFNRFFCGLKEPVRTDKNIANLNYNDNSRVVALIDSFKVELEENGKPNRIATLPGLPNYVSAQLSPDGQLALLEDKDGNVLLWNAPGAGTKAKTDTIGNYRNKFLGKESIRISPNSKYVLINVDGKARIINKNNKVTGMSDWNNERLLAFSFTPDSKSVIAVAEGKIFVMDTLLTRQANLQEIDLRSIPFIQSALEQDKINSITLSTDGKRMLIAQKNESAFLLESKNGDSLFKKNSNQDNILRIKEVGDSKNKLRASFFNDSTIISINDAGAVSLWGIYPDFEDPGNAIATVFPQPSFKEKLQNGGFTFQDVMNNTNATELNIAAEYYFSAEKIDNAKKVYQKLLEKGPPEIRGHYLNKLLEINGELNIVDRINDKLDPKRRPADTVKAYRLIKTNRLKENILYNEEKFRSCPNKEVYSKDLSTTYGSLSFNQFFVGEFEGAIESANKGLMFLESFPENDWIYTNLALGYLLTGKFKQAEVIYKEHKDKIYTDKRNSFKNGFLGDFRDLEEAGVFKNLSPEIRSDIAKIKELLNEPTIKKQLSKSAGGQSVY